MVFNTVSRLAIGIACVATPAIAFAQDTAPVASPQVGAAPATASDQEDQAGQGEIIVTAQRREERLSEVPMSITALSGDQIARSGIVSTTDLAAVTPGLQFPVSGAFAQPTIRGIGTTVTSAGSDANVADPSPGPSLLGVGSTLYFCIPPNKNLLDQWDTAADRLYKIRHCQDIDGIERKLALFAPPIDPAPPTVPGTDP